ncbi:MAG: F0F1 ATP synthase subunit B' [Alphaproteobacteria bacterium]
MMKARIYSVGCTLGILATAFPARAEDAAHAESGALPQFRTEFFAGELFWLAIAFTLLYLLLKRLALPKIAVVQNTRTAQRQGDLAAAAAANDAAKQAMAAYEKTLADARAQAQAQLSRIVTAAQHESAAAARQQQQTLETRMAEAQTRIDATLRQALSHVRETSVTATTTILHRLTGVEAGAAAARAVDKIHQKRDAA